jgi:hypothetical protein
MKKNDWIDPPDVCNGCPFVERMSARRFVCLRYETTLGAARKKCTDVKTCHRVNTMLKIWHGLGQGMAWEDILKGC